MSKQLVKCPECDNPFKTGQTDKTQCRECGARFPVKENVIKV